MFTLILKHLFCINGRNIGYNDKSALIIVANDASDNTKKMFENQCKHYQVPFYCWGLKEELGHAIGKEFRASIAVTDQGFAEALLKQLDK